MRRVLAILAALGVCSGCESLGPASIASGRAAYTDVITRTNDEQLLNTLVRMRYAETTTMMVVSAVTSQTEFSVGTGVQTGTGSSKSGFEGNLVPFALNGEYRESPTISYTPLSGAHFLKQLVTPISLDLYGLLVDSARDAESMLSLLTHGLGDMDAPVQYESARAADLAQALNLMGRLRRAGLLSFAYEVGDDDRVTGVDLVLENPDAQPSDDIRTLMKLFGRPLPARSEAQLRLPLRMGPLAAGQDALQVRTRSTLELLQLAARGVEVPEAQLAAGIAPSDEPASAQPFLHVHSSTTEPEDPFVAVQYRGYWFWVDSTDIASKRGFVAMQTLLMSCLNPNNAAQPQLSLPIG